MHEQGAGHMAQGYARASRRPGVVLVTSGPGTSNLMTPILDAALDGTPLVLLCGQVKQEVIGTGAFQEIDTMRICGPSCKQAMMIKNAQELMPTIKEAFCVSTANRPGPVAVVIPVDVTVDIVRGLNDIQIMPPVQTPLPAHLPIMSPQMLDRIMRIINSARRPVIIAGQGVHQSPQGTPLLRHFADKASIPVATTLLALGCFDEQDTKSLHFLGVHGAVYANLAVQNADTVLVSGARLDERVTGNRTRFARKAYESAQRGTGGIIHFDITRDYLNKTVKVHEAVEGDFGTCLAAPLPHIEPRPGREEWIQQINLWKAQHPFAYQSHCLQDRRIPP